MRSHNAILDTVHRRDPLHIWADDSGEPDYRRVLDLLNLSKGDVSKVSGVAKASVRFDDRMPEPVRLRLDEICNVAALVAEFFEGDLRKTALWFRTPNPMFGKLSPRDMIRLGRYQKLLAYILEARNEHIPGGREEAAA